MKRLLTLLLLVMTACVPANQPEDTVPTPASAVNSTESRVDILANLPEVDCSAGLTPQDQEGPYFKANSPETTSLFMEGMQGKKLILVGQVVTVDCLPIPNVLIDFWQADTNGEYDNVGYNLRGHQYSDNKGRYYLETIFPGIYSSRPIRHIHVKVTSPSGMVLTTQLYFPEQPVDGLTVQLEGHGDYYLAIFNFVIKN
ncbi:MAG: intradiol ring-cleavage dioxygenase [Anaerolineae bacterium]|nr:intradiol ring-cleavage dioxygenase [Anaerolineae bacterium]